RSAKIAGRRCRWADNFSDRRKASAANRKNHGGGNAIYRRRRLTLETVHASHKMRNDAAFREKRPEGWCHHRRLYRRLLPSAAVTASAVAGLPMGNVLPRV